MHINVSNERTEMGSLGVHFSGVNFICGLLVAGAALFGVGSASAAETLAPADEIRAVMDQVTTVVVESKGKFGEEEIERKLREIIMPVFNFEEMSKRSLGSIWAKASAEEQKECFKLFRDLRGRTSLKRIRRNAETSKLAHVTETMDGGSAMVKTKVKTADEDIAIDYRFNQVDGRWRVYDVVVENVGLVSNYRNEFGTLLRRDGFPGLLKKLREKTAANAAADRQAIEDAK